MISLGSWIQAAMMASFLLHSVGIRGNRLRQILGKLKDIRVSADALLADIGAYTVNIRDKIQELYAGHEFRKGPGCPEYTPGTFWQSGDRFSQKRR